MESSIAEFLLRQPPAYEQLPIERQTCKTRSCKETPRCSHGMARKLLNQTRIALIGVYSDQLGSGPAVPKWAEHEPSGKCASNLIGTLGK